MKENQANTDSWRNGMEKSAGIPGLRLKDMPPRERPMEKMGRLGRKSLSDAELLAILLRSGCKGQNALQVAYRILSGDSGAVGLDYLRDADPCELAAFAGVGQVKAHQIVAALELGARVRGGENQTRAVLNSPERVYAYLKEDMAGMAQEEMHALLLDVKNRVIRHVCVCRGGLASLVIQPREIMHQAVRASAASFILAHNHPSGDPAPSREDRESTVRLKQAGELLGIPLQDHVIVARDGFYSMKRSTAIWS